METEDVSWNDVGGAKPADSSSSSGGQQPSTAAEEDESSSSQRSNGALSSYLARVLPGFLGGSPGDDFESVSRAIEQSADSISRFVSDAQCGALVCERRPIGTKDEADSDSSPVPSYEYAISNEIRYSGPKTCSVVILKRGSQIVDVDKQSLLSQIMVCSMPENGNPLQSVQCLSSNLCLPYFKSYVSSAESKKGSSLTERRNLNGVEDQTGLGDKITKNVEKRFADLDTLLVNLQQNIDIPQIRLTINSYVSCVVKKCFDAENRKASVDDFADKLEDSTFLNALQSGVNRWIHDIRQVTRLDRDPASGTSLQEVNFWLNLDSELNRIQEMRDSFEVQLTLDILKAGKRFHPVISFDTDTGLTQALERVRDYNVLMKDFPINNLLSATDVDSLHSSVKIVFAGIRKIRNTKYPIPRVIHFINAISRDLSNQMLKILSKRKLIQMDYDEFERLVNQCLNVFSLWDEEYNRFQDVSRDVLRKKRGALAGSSSSSAGVMEHSPHHSQRFNWRFTFAHQALESRLGQVKKFRHQHEQLLSVIMRVLTASPQPEESSGQSIAAAMTRDEEGGGDEKKAPAATDPIEEVKAAYDVVRSVDVFDVSKEGNAAWEAGMRMYESRIDRVERTIASRLRNQLAKARSANEMFRIFSRFNALFVRSHIRGAIGEYQTRLIEHVKVDIENLQKMFADSYSDTGARRILRSRDFPPMSGYLIWVKQIERQLDLYLKRVEDVLGRSWEAHIEGAKLKAEGDAFRERLSTQPIFDEWKQRATQKTVSITGNIFTIESIRRDMYDLFRLKANFTLEAINLYKEYRQFRVLGFRIPVIISNKAQEINNVYPLAIALNDGVQSLDWCNDELMRAGIVSAAKNSEVRVNVVEGDGEQHACPDGNENHEFEMIDLLAQPRHSLHRMIEDGISNTWESYKLVTYAYAFADAVFQYQVKVEELVKTKHKIDTRLADLESCRFSAETIEKIMNDIQDQIENITRKSFSNIDHFVSSLDEQIELILKRKLIKAIDWWTRSLASLNANNSEFMDDRFPKIEKSHHELWISNQALTVKPPIEKARSNLLNQLFKHTSAVLLQKRIRSLSSARRIIGNLSEYQTTYKSLFDRVTESQEGLDALSRSFNEINMYVNSAIKYVENWLDFQSLWDLQPEVLFEQLGDDVSRWMKCIRQIKEARKTFDTQDICMTIGPIKIQYERVQSKVSLKYDSWHRDVLNRFGQMLGSETKSFYDELLKSRHKLEQATKADDARTMDAINLVTDVQKFKKKIPAWKTKLDVYSEAQKTLHRQRYQFPPNWIEIENLNGQWLSFNDILHRTDSAIQSQLDVWRRKASVEFGAMIGRFKNLLTDWNANKPTGGEISPTKALKILKSLEAQMIKLKDEKEVLTKAKLALEIDDHDDEHWVNVNFKSAMEELTSLKDVWNDLSRFWASIDQMRETPWLAVQAKRIRQQLSDIYSDFLNVSSSRYAPSEHLRSVLDNYIKSNPLLSDLRSEALKPRHWSMLASFLGHKWPSLKDLTLGDVWDSNLAANERRIRDVMNVAQGESALEEFLRQLNDQWKAYNLDVAKYDAGRVFIIRQWDDLLEKIRENLNSINSMKMSPYYKQFVEESTIWEDRLNRMNLLFDTWIEVQRRYLYLDGLFGQGADVKQLLPLESHKFVGVSSDYIGLMQRVAQAPNVLDVLAFNSIQKWLDRLLDLLVKIQKALGDYLEKERSAFPRFYFVGDEDLLEMVGSSKDVSKVQKHVKKMFAGVCGFVVENSQDSPLIVAVTSREGEQVKLLDPVRIKDYSSINGWLSVVDKSIRSSLELMLSECYERLSSLSHDAESEEDFLTWIDQYPAQLVVLAVQSNWTAVTEKSLTDRDQLGKVYNDVQYRLDQLAASVLKQHPTIRRKKLEHLIIEYVHERDVIRDLIGSTEDDFVWQSHMRFYYNSKSRALKICMADAEFMYGYEYLGVQEKLVQTPLTDRCYLSMTQALKNRLGGSPFGPAGTGKTETIKSLGNQLGRFVLVFNCDESFDFQAMGRILIGLCQVGAWGCFDEFNRLEERMLSAISQQIQSIQEALRGTKGSHVPMVELLDKNVHLNPDVAVFITMNPGYAGRSNLPDNLKKLFRSLAMTRPDMVLIAEIMLYSQGFNKAESLAKKASVFFRLCNEQLSAQKHYDFGLRSLKSVLLMAGNIKREDRDQQEQHILIRSIMQSFSPRLVAGDLDLLKSLLSEVFPDVGTEDSIDFDLLEKIREVCVERNLSCFESDSNDQMNCWARKVLQLNEILSIHHGVMLVGPSGSGKSQAWRTLMDALNRQQSADSEKASSSLQARAYVIDPKSLSKDELFGVMDPNTREWTDGLFTHLLRKITSSAKPAQRNWIVFDGDVDPEWVENLNSVLDDNKLLTLPNGDRLLLSPNIRIMFEVADLRSATLATVSRCGMIYFSEQTVTASMITNQFLNSLDENLRKALSPMFAPGNIVHKCLSHALTHVQHIMDFTQQRALDTLFALITAQSNKLIGAYNRTHEDFPLTFEQVTQIAQTLLQYCLVWAFAGDCQQKQRDAFANYVHDHMNGSANIVDCEVILSSGQGFADWRPWETRVPQIEVDADRIGEVVVPTVDTVRHEAIVKDALTTHRCLILCGPPGCGKTMTLLSLLRNDLPDYELVTLNFSSGSNIDLLTRSLDQHLEVRRSPSGIVLSAPTTAGATTSSEKAPDSVGASAGGSSNKWIVFFCDEINLPNPDNYGTQRILSFMRQVIENGGFYRNQQFITLERVMFVGACNPPTDPGRKPLPLRFLRHVNLLYVDYSSGQSLRQIYGIFNRSILKPYPLLQKFAEPMTEAMIETYCETQEYFTIDKQAHYVYSPRELTRWVRGLHEAIRFDPSNDSETSLSAEELVRLWANEALRLFRDRLVFAEERDWMEELIDRLANRHFGQGVDMRIALEKPILFSDWISRRYSSVKQADLRAYVQARLKTYQEEQLCVDVVLFDDMLDYCLRIDRVFKQPSGHLLLIGVPGSGRTTMVRFVAWINGLAVVQLKPHSKYTMANFDEDLKGVLRRCACKQERVVFVLDYESSLLGTGFLERMNTLLANGEVPGLFEGDDYIQLINECKNVAQRQGSMIDSHDDVYRWFSGQIVRNLHVVLTMTGSADGLDMTTMSTSPALFNRCVLNWFGDWSERTLYQVASELIRKLDIGNRMVDDQKRGGSGQNGDEEFDEGAFRDALVRSCVFVHRDMSAFTTKIILSPRQYLDFISHFITLLNEKRTNAEDEQLHLKTGLSKITETFDQVEELQQSLREKRKELELKNEAASVKLAQMVSNQQEAESRRVTSVELRTQLTAKLKVIDEKTREVRGDLERVEPAVNEAKQAVQGIKRQHLIELRSLREPPAPVKLTLESVCLLLGQETTEWKTLRTFVMGDGFIGTIINFKTESVSSATLEKMKNRYLSNPDFNFEKVNKGSQACGPLFKWVTAQLEYSVMLNKVGPLRRELKQLEQDASINEKRAVELEGEIQKLEVNIERYKQEYAELIREAQSIKSDLQQVEAKVSRSVALLHSLSREKNRWEDERMSYHDQVHTLVGDVFACAAFLAYAGNFDQLARKDIWTRWICGLSAARIPIREDLSRIEFLSTPDERLNWLDSTDDDDVCVENAIMLSRRAANRYPLIIDPSGSGSIVKFLNEQQSGKVIVTSFMDQSFKKQLESSLRFGNTIMVQDAEYFDPIIIPVLNHELRQMSGRMLVSLTEQQDIDFSPSFRLFMHTKESNAKFSSSLCSRVSLVNFTVTPASLQAQCLRQVLKSERPDVEKRRSDLAKLQGEFQQKLRRLEKELLVALNERGEGRGILDDDAILARLETLKREATEVSEKASETENVMSELEQTSRQYASFIGSCSSIFFALQSMETIHFLYSYSLDFFMKIFNEAIRLPTNSGDQDPKARIESLKLNLFRTTYERVKIGILDEHRVLFGLSLLRLFRVSREPKTELIFDFMFTNATRDLPSSLEEARGRVRALCDRFDWGCSGVELDDSWLSSAAPEMEKPLFEDDLVNLLVIQSIRPDRFSRAAQLCVEAQFGEFERSIDRVVAQEVSSGQPVLLCSPPGHDASVVVEQELITRGAIAADRIRSIALGSAEGFQHAEQAIKSAARTGKWVLLKNAHLALNWLSQLDKQLAININSSSNNNDQFRLFVSMEIAGSTGVPSNLLRISRVIVHEPSSGLIGNIKRTLATIAQDRMDRNPKERATLYLALVWLHSVILERIRYVPYGWTKAYDFSEADLQCGLDVIDIWLDRVSGQRTNVQLNMIPWSALRTLLKSCVYGGRIDNEFDRIILDSMIDRLFTPNLFSPDFNLIGDDVTTEHDDDPHLLTSFKKLPRLCDKKSVEEWVAHLPEHEQSPTWLGLGQNADQLIMLNSAFQTCAKLRIISGIGAAAESLSNTKDGGIDAEMIKSDVKASLLEMVIHLAQTWLNKLPHAVESEFGTLRSRNNQLTELFDRESRQASALLELVRTDLQSVCTALQVTNDGSATSSSKIVLTNQLRQLISDLSKGTIPNSWKMYLIPEGTTVEQWLIDFAKRIDHFNSLSKSFTAQPTTTSTTTPLILGNLFSPQAYLTVTRRIASQRLRCPIDQLTLSVLSSDDDVNGTASIAGDQNNNQQFWIDGLTLDGAGVAVHDPHTSPPTIGLVNANSAPNLPKIALKWTTTPNADQQHQQQLSTIEHKVKIPVYLNRSRSTAPLTTFEFRVAAGTKDHEYWQRGCAVLLCPL